MDCRNHKHHEAQESSLSYEKALPSMEQAFFEGNAYWTLRNEIMGYHQLHQYVMDDHKLICTNMHTMTL